MDEKQLQALYNAMHSSLDLGDYNTFKKTIASDTTYRKAIYNQASEELDLGDYNTWNKNIGFDSQETKKQSLPFLQTPDQQLNQVTSNVVPQSATPPQPKAGNQNDQFLNFGEPVKPATNKLAVAVNKDKKKEGSVLGGVYNTLVGSIARAAGGTMELGADLTKAAITPFVKGSGKDGEFTEADKAARNAIISKVGGSREDVTNLIEKARSSSSTKEQESIRKDFDVTNGVTADDVEAMMFQAPSQLADMALGALSAGSSFFVQSVNDNAEELDKNQHAANLTDNEKLGYLLTQATVQAALEKLSLNAIFKSTGLGKGVQQKISKEIIDEFVEKGTKATAKEIEELAIKKASQFVSKAKRVGVGTAMGALAEGGTEGVQSVASDAIKIATNKISGKDVFDEEDIKKNFIKNAINSTVLGGAFGGVFGGLSGTVNNTNKAIREQVSQAQTPEDLQAIQQQINEQVEAGNITEEEANNANIKAQQYVGISSKIPSNIDADTKYKIIGGIDQRNDLETEIQKVQTEIESLDPAFQKDKKNQVELLQAKLGEVNDYLEGIVEGGAPTYEEKNGKYIKISASGDETEIPKQQYEFGKAIQENEKSKTEEPINTGDIATEPINTIEDGKGQRGKERGQELLTTSEENQDTGLTKSESVEKPASSKAPEIVENVKVEQPLSSIENESVKNVNFSGFEKEEMLTAIDIREDTVSEDISSASGIEKIDGALNNLREKIIKGDNNFTKGEIEWLKSEADELLSKTEAAIDADGNSGAKKQLPKIKKFIERLNETKAQTEKPIIQTMEGSGSGNEFIKTEEGRTTEAIIPETTQDTGTQPPIPEPPSGQPPTGVEDNFDLPESNQERIRGAYQHLISSNIDQSVKDKFDEYGITYKVANSAEAQKVSQNIIQSFGVEKALELARLNTFHPSVNSAVFASAIDNFQEAETSATTQSDKFINAKQWADTYDEYAQRLTESGQFGAYAYQFYKTSPIGFVISSKKRIDARREYFIKKDEKALKELWEEIKEVPEFKEYFEQQVTETVGKSKREVKAEKRKKIIDSWDKLKLNKTQVYAVPVPLQIINGAIEAMKQAHLLGFEVADIIAEGVKYINTNHKDGWDEEKFKKDFTPIAESLVKDTTKKRASTTTKEKILKKWDKKLTKLEPEKRKELLSRVLNQIVLNGGMEYDNFKQMYADALGIPSMTPEMQDQLRELGTKLNNVDKARDELNKENVTQKDIDNFLQAEKEGEIAARKVNDLLGEKGITLDRVLTITKLNTLGIANLIVNPVFNLFYQPIRFLESTVRMGLDYGLHYAGFSKGEIKENPFYKQRYYWKKFGEGFVKSIKDIATGEASFDYFQKPTRQTIQPIESAKDLYNHFSGGKKLTTSEIANAILEAFPLTGGSAAFIARSLQIGDLPFRYSAEGAEAENIATQKGLKGVAKKAFILNPDEESKERIKTAGEKAVMAQENALTKAINTVGVVLKNYTKENRRGKLAYAASKVIGATTQPFIKIPLNSAYTVFQLAVPEFSFAMGVFEAVRGHKEAALQNFTKAIVGYSLGYAISQIAAVGLLSGTDDEKEKVGASIYMSDYVGNNSLNMSGIKRWLRGGNPDYQQGDVTWNTNMMGAMGALMQLYAAQYDKMTPEQWDKEGVMSDILYRTKGGLIDGMKSNVFGNTSTLLNAIDEGNTYSLNKWLRSSLGVLGNTVEPSWLAAFSRVRDGYKADYTAMNTSEQLKSMLKERLFMGKDLPSQITVWGEKRTDTPKGTNPMVYYYLDITKSQNVDVKDFGFNIMALYKRTKEDAVIPSRPQKTLRVGNKSYQLTPTEYEQFQIMVGRNRKELVMALMSDSEYYGATDEEKIKKLTSVYSEGYQLGKEEFIMANPNTIPEVEEDGSY